MFFPVNGDPYRDNVVLHLPMTGANNSTDFIDVSPTPKTITVHGNTKISTAQSKWGQGAGYFDETGDYLSVPYSSDFDFGAVNVAIEAWIYIAWDSPPDADGIRSAAIMNTWTTTIKGWTFSVIGSSVTTGTGLAIDSWSDSIGNGTLYRAAVSISKGAWHHVKAAVQSGVRQLFLDGELLSGSTITVGAGYTQINAFNVLNIGKSINDSYPLPFYGRLQDVRITKYVSRSDSTIPNGPLPYRSPELPVRSSIIQPSFNRIARLGL